MLESEAMVKNIIGVYVEDPEIFRSVARKLKEKGICFTLDFNVEKPDVCLVITDSPWKIKGKVKILVVRNCEEVEYVIERAVLAVKGALVFSSLLIGVDPGENMGLAIIGDGRFIRGKTFRKIEELISEIESTINNLLFIKCKIKVGSRSRFSEKILTEVLKIRKPNVIVEVVDEKTVPRTIPRFILKGAKIPKDVISAVNIAFAKGVEVTSNATKNSYPRKK